MSTKLFTTIFLCIFHFFVFAQKDSIQKNDEMRTIFSSIQTHGGYGALCYRYETFNDKDIFANGGKFAWIINRKFAIGVCGIGFNSNTSNSIAGGYGGLTLEPIFFSNSVVHFTLPTLIGAGGVGYRKSVFENHPELKTNRDAQAFFVAETGIEIEVNVFKFLRFGCGGYYRYTSNLDIKLTNELFATHSPIVDEVKHLNNFLFGFCFKFGKF